MLRDPGFRACLERAGVSEPSTESGAIAAAWEAVRSGGVETRWAALSFLVWRGADGLVDPLCALVRDSGGLLRAAVVRLLGGLGDPAAVPTLRAALGDAEPTVRAAAGGALAVMPGGEVGWLSPVVRDRDEYVRWQVVGAVAGLRHERMAPVLAEVVRTEPSERVRAAAIRGLGALPGLAPVAGLRAALRDESPPNRQAAAEGLHGRVSSEWVAELVPLLLDARLQTRDAAEAALGGAPMDAAGALVRALDHPERDVRGRAARLLEAVANRELGASGRPGAVAVRRAGALALRRASAPDHDGTGCEPRSASALARRTAGALARTDGEAPTHRLGQAEAPGTPRESLELRRVDGEAVREALVRSLAAHGDPDVARVLARSRSADRLWGLAFLLGDDPATVGELRHAGARALDALAAAATRGTADARAWACRLLGEVGGSSEIPILINGLGDIFPDVRLGAALGLAAIGTPDATDALLAALRRRAFWQGMTHGDSARPALSETGSLTDAVTADLAAGLVLPTRDRAEALLDLFQRLATLGHVATDAVGRATIRETTIQVPDSRDEDCTVDDGAYLLISKA